MADQGLPTGFDNTASVWEYMPAIAAMQVGQQNNIAQDNNAALQRAFQGEQDFLAQKRPLDLNQLVAQTGLTNANTGHTNAQTTGINLGNDLTRATQDSNIEATNTGNSAKAGNARGQIYGQLAAEVGNMPEGTPDFYKAMYVAQKLGIRDPAIIKQMTDHADILHTSLSSMNNNMYDRSPEGRKEFQHNMTMRDIAGVNTESAQTIEQMRIDAGKYNKANSSQWKLSLEGSLANAKTAAQKYAVLRDFAMRAEQENQPLAAELLRDRAEEQRVQAEKELANAGAGAVGYDANGKPRIVPKGENTKLPGPNKPKPGETNLNPIKLD